MIDNGFWCKNTEENFYFDWTFVREDQIFDLNSVSMVQAIFYRFLPFCLVFPSGKREGLIWTGFKLQKKFLAF